MEARSIAFFASHFETPYIPENEMNILDQLIELFDVVYFLYSGNGYNKYRYKNVRMISTPNKGLDFGKWYRVLSSNLVMQYPNLELILLINDSCHVGYGKSISSIFDMARKKRLKDFWGLTNSYEVAYHLQSYFLVFRGIHAIRSMLKFFDNLDPSFVNYDKNSIVARCEVGLSQHMISNGHDAHSIYDVDWFYKQYDLQELVSKHNLNLSYRLPRILEQYGCPLIKKKNRPIL